MITIPSWESSSFSTASRGSSTDPSFKMNSKRNTLCCLTCTNRIWKLFKQSSLKVRLWSTATTRNHQSTTTTPQSQALLHGVTLLKDRISEPFKKIDHLGKGITEREEYKDVEKLYQNIIKIINDYEESRIGLWEKDVDESTHEKLKYFLIGYDETSENKENGLLKVNFDPILVRTSQRSQIPEAAQSRCARNSLKTLRKSWYLQTPGGFSWAYHSELQQNRDLSQWCGGTLGQGADCPYEQGHPAGNQRVQMVVPRHRWFHHWGQEDSRWPLWNRR